MLQLQLEIMDLLLVQIWYQNNDVYEISKN